MSTTNIPAGSPLANKQFSKALAAMATRAPTPLKMLTGPMSSEDKALAYTIVVILAAIVVWVVISMIVGMAMAMFVGSAIVASGLTHY